MSASPVSTARPAVVLPLTRGPSRPSHSLASVLHTLLATLSLFLRLPFHLSKHYLLLRRSSPLVQHLGRPVFVQVVVQTTRLFFSKVYLAAGRPVFAFALPSRWVGKTMSVAGTRGRWIRPPGSEGKRGEDEVVLLWVHGGGFTIDASGSCQLFHTQLAKRLNLKRGVAFSIFMLDYKLSPEAIYPTQLLEALAAYHHLGNELGIPPSRICIGGDSAGGTIVSGLLLHLARPNPRIKLPLELGKTPEKPGSVLLISPFISLVSSRRSRTPPYFADYLDTGSVFRGALAYIGVVPPYPSALSAWKVHSPSWSPLRWFSDDVAVETPPAAETLLSKGMAVEQAEEEGGLSLLNSPYVNPGIVEDLGWLKEAYPSDGRTMVSWGGKEIFANDVADFVSSLMKAGVAPVELYKPLAVHDWPIFDSFIPLSSRDTNGGDHSKWDYGLSNVVDFLAAQAEEKEHE